jgi:hypothetical protein
MFFLPFGVVDLMIFAGLPMALSMKKVVAFCVLKVALGF